MFVNPAGRSAPPGAPLVGSGGGNCPATHWGHVISLGANTLSALATRLGHTRGACARPPGSLAGAFGTGYVHNRFARGERNILPKVRNVGNAAADAPNIVVGTPVHHAQMINGLRDNRHYATLEAILGNNQTQGIISYFNFIDQFSQLALIIDKFQTYNKEQKISIFRSIIRIVDIWPNAIARGKDLLPIKGEIWRHFCRQALPAMPPVMLPFIYIYLLPQTPDFPKHSRIGIFNELIRCAHYLPRHSTENIKAIFYAMLVECYYYPQGERVNILSKLINKLTVLAVPQQLETLWYIWRQRRSLVANEHLVLVEKEIAGFYFQGLHNTGLNRHNLRFFDALVCKYYPKVTAKILPAALYQ